MPTYQYACTECDHKLEQFQSFHDDALTVCPACEGRLRKVFNAVGVVFKGSGFYRNDSRTVSDGAANGKKSESGDAAASADKTEKTGASGTKADSNGSKTSKGDSTTTKPASSAPKDSTTAA